MFGLNDTDTQATDGTNGQSQATNPPVPPPNPFADSAAGEPERFIHPMPANDGPAAAGTQPAAPVQKSDDLLDLKEQALTSLQPLVGHLDQTPEEKFKTTMMLIQATDNAALVKEAYQAANQITDEKARAQALLDVVNEINYFTQHNGETEDKPPQG